MKQYIIVRTDLKMPKGKTANQVAHASIGASRNLPNHIIDKWLEDGKQTKIILKVNSLELLLHYYEACGLSELRPYMVTNLTNDKWKSEKTCFGIGPYEDERLEGIFKDLKLL